MTMAPGAFENEIVVLAQADPATKFGGKSANLAKALTLRLPVPGGFGVSALAVAEIDAGNTAAISRLRKVYDTFDGLAAVRSSAIDEDSEEASFAGQHSTLLGVLGFVDLLAAIMKVNASGLVSGVHQYRQQMGVATTASKVAVTVQRLVNPTLSGVLFTKDPIDGADARIAEAAWGLGEVVVGSLVTPDHLRFARGGHVLERRVGHKELSLHPKSGGGIETRRCEQEKAQKFCMSSEHISQLDALADQCEQAFDGPQDIEWAIEDDQLYLLQSRPITTISTG